MNSSDDLIDRLRNGKNKPDDNLRWHVTDTHLEAASHIEAQDKLLAEIAQELRYALIALEWGDIERLHDRLAALSQKDTP